MSKLGYNTYLSVIWNVWINEDIHTFRRQQFSMNCSGLSLHFSRVLDYVNLNGEVDNRNHCLQTRKWFEASVAEELS